MLTRDNREFFHCYYPSSLDIWHDNVMSSLLIATLNPVSRDSQKSQETSD
ncbi:conserved hypothetical protein [Yersinia pestis Pestoides F]|uniref:Uncharacterized protein n=1 Tax=Yersinia pestis TaxID=632 RepID=Q8CKZ8_YERPE|nr:hypothetical [Yersinia pestis KIM10+]ABP39761.1 conserved hypothetical protein [Yersinia pestis Pestoides F]ABX85481.1 conserved hypothetical protein [Yersinia pestis Angola]EDR37355.1 conserved hypothetical protein [Yersinia pestis biovar Orientalis str. F1991016]EDR57931.1 conserved hypothetical protein [Yersinia pestis biovar Orientalis str. MG05-1020]EDR59853.1 conserved hypothetical protein [Yersinia pestis biovar Antiqua str. UG05-0454]EEO76461.1 hypothetical protein YP516_2669 [Yers